MSTRILFLVAVIAVGCSGGHQSSQLSGTAASTPSTRSTPPTTAGSVFSTDTAAPTTTARPGGLPASTTTVPSVSPSPPSGSVRPPSPAAAGTYRYRQSGTSTFGGATKPVPSEGTLHVDAASSSGTQTWHRVVDPSQPPSDTVFLFHANGAFISQLVMRSKIGAQTQTFTCTFATPLASPPWPPTVGTSYQGHADCGAFTIDVRGSVTGTRDVNVSGAAHRTFVLASALAVHGQLEGSGTQTDWVDPATSLLLHEETSLSAVYGGFYKLGGSTTSDIESVTPS